MLKKYLPLIVVIILLIIGGWIFVHYSSDQEQNENITENPKSIIESKCKNKEMIFYYLEQCSWCQKVKQKGTISKIEELGVKVKQVNANVGPIQHQFQGVPTFIIDEKVYSGYRTFEELKELLGCQKEKSQSSSNIEFAGEKGEEIFLRSEQAELSANLLEDGLAHYYHTKLPNGKMIYFFIIKDKKGIYRAAANACQVCFDARMGFRQEGDFMVCNTCGNKYPLEKIATEKGGCNPGPINPNLEVKDNKVIIRQSELEQVAEFF